MEEALLALRRDPLNGRACGVLVRYQRSRGIAPEATPEAKPPGERTWLAMNATIETLEREDRLFRASVQPEVGRLLYGLARNLKPRLVVETGSFLGYSALCLGQALAENGAGHLHAFDLFPPRPWLESPVAGACGDSLAAARRHIAAAGLSAWVTFHQGDSAGRIRETLGSQRETVDLAFIDGDHRIPGCLRDWEALDPLIGEGGIIVLHDTSPDAGWLGPRWLLEKLDQTARERYACITLPLVDGAGMALVQKRTPGRAPQWRPTLRDLLTDWLFVHRAGWREGPK